MPIVKQNTGEIQSRGAVFRRYCRFESSEDRVVICLSNDVGLEQASERVRLQKTGGTGLRILCQIISDLLSGFCADDSFLYEALKSILLFN